MTDFLDQATRSERMRRVRQSNTAPELALRRALHAQGLRYRLHPKQLPGRPDIVFPAARVALFVHGCFWHGHVCSAGRAPASNVDFWGPKLAANRERDARKEQQLRELGWTVLVVWECELKSTEGVARTAAVVAEQVSAERLGSTRRPGAD
jgi:DNA mismatch endonuclease (patch repair protein)